MSLQAALLDYLRGKFPRARISDNTPPGVELSDDGYAIRWDTCDEGGEEIDGACDAFVAGWHAAREAVSAREGQR